MVKTKVKGIGCKEKDIRHNSSVGYKEHSIGEMGIRCNEKGIGHKEKGIWHNEKGIRTRDRA